MALEIDMFIQTLINGVLLSGLYVLMTTGLSLVYGTMRMANSAQAAFAVAGAYVSYFSFTLLGIDPFASVLLSFVVLFLIGIAIYRFFASRTLELPVMNFLLTFTIAVLMENTMILLWRNDYKTINSYYTGLSWKVLGYSFPIVRTVSFVISMAFVALLVSTLYYTRFGKAVRATAQNRDSAWLMGINVNRTFMLTFGIAAGISGVAGGLLAQIAAFYPSMHLAWIGRLYAITILGGLGSIFGTVGASFVISLSEALLGTYSSVLIGEILTYILMLLIIKFKPEGLLGGRK